MPCQNTQALDSEVDVMSEVFEAQEINAVQNRGSNFVVIGLIITFLAFSISISSPWILETLRPPPPPASEDVSQAENDQTISKWLYSFIISDENQNNSDENNQSKGEAKEKETQPKHWTDNWSYIVMVIALGGLLSSIIGLLQRQNKYIGWTGVFLGASAIMLQYIVITLIILAIIVFFVFLLSAIGVEF